MIRLRSVMHKHHWYAWGLGLSLFLFGAEAGANCNDPFASPDAILEFHLQTTRSVWTELQDSDIGMSCEDQYPYFEVGFRCGNEAEFIPIGARKKRDRSASDFKPPIKLDFNRVVEDQRWPAARGNLGFRKLSLNSGQPDDTQRRGGDPESADGVLSALVTEHLSWRLMREEVPEASGVAYAKLTLHFTDTGESQYQGLYILIEDIDRTAIRARFGADEGTMWKTSTPSCRNNVVFDDGPPNSATDAFDTWIGLNPDDFAGSWYERTDQVMHLDMLLRQEALRELLVNTADSVLGRANNFFAVDLYGERRRYLPWDLDDMFRPQPQIHAPDTPLVESCVGAGGTCAPTRVGVNIRGNVEIRPRYLQTLCDISNGTGNEAKIVAEIEAIDRLIRPVIALEVPVLWEPRGADPLNASTPGTYAAEIERMRSWVPARVQAVRGLIAAEGVECPAGCSEGETRRCEAFGTSIERSCQGGRWTPCELPTAPGGAGAGGAGGGIAGPSAGAAGSDAASGTGSGGVTGAGAAPNVGGASPNAGSNDGGSGEPVLPNTDATPNSVGGCGCRVGGGPRPGRTTLLYALGLSVMLRRRRASTSRN